MSPNGRESLRKAREAQLRIMLTAVRVWEGRALAYNCREELARVREELTRLKALDSRAGWGSGLDYSEFSSRLSWRGGERLAA